MAVLSSDVEDLQKMDIAVADFVALSGAILNRNCKSVIVRLGTWEAIEDWPLPWIQSAHQVKVYSFVFALSLETTITLSWDRVVTSLKVMLRMWTGCHVPTLASIYFKKTFAKYIFWSRFFTFLHF
jgi:hypothetical protein